MKKVRKLTSRKWGVSNSYKAQKIAEVVRGWINYFKIGSILTATRRLDTIIRYRFRMCIWKHWKNPKTRYRNLIKLGVSKKNAKSAAGFHGYARVCRTETICYAMSNARLKKFGLLSAVYRRGKELYETAGVFDFSYDMYLVDELPVADVKAKVRGVNQEFYEVTASIDEEFGDVTNCNCGCEAFYNYEGMCKHCVAMLLHYVNHRTAVEILRVKGQKKAEPENPEQRTHP